MKQKILSVILMLTMLVGAFASMGTVTAQAAKSDIMTFIAGYDEEHPIKTDHYVYAQTAKVTINVKTKDVTIDFVRVRLGKRDESDFQSLYRPTKDIPEYEEKSTASRSATLKGKLRNIEYYGGSTREYYIEGLKEHKMLLHAGLGDPGEAWNGKTARIWYNPDSTGHTIAFWVRHVEPFSESLWGYECDYMIGEAPSAADYKIGTDNFSFSNREKVFTDSYAEKLPYNGIKPASYTEGTIGSYVDDAMYEKLTKGLSKLETAFVNVWLGYPVKDGLSGGMSALSGLIFTEKLNLSRYTDKKSAYKAETPKNNRKLAEDIVYYQLRLNLLLDRAIANDAKNLCKEDGSKKTWLANLKKAMNVDTPVVVCVKAGYNKGEAPTKQGLLLYKMEQGDYSTAVTGKLDRKLSFYDPNVPDKAMIVYVNSKTGDVYSPDYKYFDMISYHTLDEIYNGETKVPALKASSLTVSANGKVTISNGSNQATVEDGKVVKNKGFKITSLGVDSSGTTELLIDNYSAKKKLQVKATGKNAAVTVAGRNLAAAAEGEKSVYLTLTAKGAVKAQSGDKKADMTAWVMSSKTTGSLPGTSVCAVGGSIEITPTKAGSKVKTSDKKSDVTVFGGEKSKTVKDADTGKQQDVSVKDGKLNVGKNKSTGDSDTTDSKDTTGKDSTADKGGSDSKDTTGSKDGDLTGYKASYYTGKQGDKPDPTDWVVPGKYVREDGSAVLYIDYSEYPNLYYPCEIYVVADGDKKVFSLPSEDATLKEIQENGSIKNEFATMWVSSEYGEIASIGLRLLIIPSDDGALEIVCADDALFSDYSSPAGVYKKK